MGRGDSVEFGSCLIFGPVFPRTLVVSYGGALSTPQHIRQVDFEGDCDAKECVDRRIANNGHRRSMFLRRLGPDPGTASVRKRRWLPPNAKSRVARGDAALGHSRNPTGGGRAGKKLARLRPDRWCR